ncbi:MAG: DUF883 C-terminal domain-containing protein [Reyranellaceae bacterium]
MPSTRRDTKDLADQIALLRGELDALAKTVNGSGESLLDKGQAALDDVLKSGRDLVARYDEIKGKASDAVIGHAETRPLTTVAAIAGLGFLLGYLMRRR